MTIDQYKALTTRKQPKPRIRLPRRRVPNATEAEYMATFKDPELVIMYEPFSLNLPSGTRYTPDVVIIERDKSISIHEVKGAHIHNSASIRAFKEARVAFPCWKFVFAQKLKTGWTTAE